MAPGSAAKPTARKRNRKRKRRNVSSSSSSSSSSDSESSSGGISEHTPATTAKLRVHGRTVVKVVSAAGEDVGDDDSSDSESSSGSNSSAEESDVDMVPTTQPVATAANNLASTTSAEPSAAPMKTVKMRQRYESPPPVKDVPPPTMLPTNDVQKEQALKDRFRKFWMSNIADAFADDLNTIRNVCFSSIP